MVSDTNTRILNKCPVIGHGIAAVDILSDLPLTKEERNGYIKVKVFFLANILQMEEPNVIGSVRNKGKELQLLLLQLTVLLNVAIMEC